MGYQMTHQMMQIHKSNSSLYPVIMEDQFQNHSHIENKGSKYKAHHTKCWLAIIYVAGQKNYKQENFA